MIHVLYSSATPRNSSVPDSLAEIIRFASKVGGALRRARRGWNSIRRPLLDASPIFDLMRRASTTTFNPRASQSGNLPFWRRAAAQSRPPSNLQPSERRMISRRPVFSAGLCVFALRLPRYPFLIFDEIAPSRDSKHPPISARTGSNSRRLCMFFLYDPPPAAP